MLARADSRRAADRGNIFPYPLTRIEMVGYDIGMIREMCQAASERSERKEEWTGMNL